MCYSIPAIYWKSDEWKFFRARDIQTNISNVFLIIHFYSLIAEINSKIETFGSKNCIKK